MKIAFVNQPWNTVNLPEASGSIAIWTYEVARCLAKSADVIVYAKQDKLQKKVESYEGVEYRRITLTPDQVILKLLPRFSGFNQQHPLFASSLYYLGYILQVAADLTKQQCDIVHLHNFSQFVPIIRAFNPRIKIVLHMHGEWLTQLNPSLIKQRLSKVDLILGCSNYLTEKIRSRFPDLASHCQTVYNGVNVERFVKGDCSVKNQETSNPNLLFVGRVSPEKGVHLLLDAFKQVTAHYPEATLAIVGLKSAAQMEVIVGLSDDPKVQDLVSFYSGESYISQLRKRLPTQIASQVSFVGHLPQTKLLDYYHRADLLVNPSLSESFGMSLIEAMATEVPVVASRVGGMTEVVAEGKTGLLVEANDVSALAEAILHLLSNLDLREAMGKAGRQRVVELFQWERVAESLLQQYQKCI